MSDIPFIWEVNGQVTPTIVAGNLLLTLGWHNIVGFLRRMAAGADNAFTRGVFMLPGGTGGLAATGAISVLAALNTNMARGQRWPHHVLDLLKNASFAAGVITALQLFTKAGSYDPYEMGLGSKRWGVVRPPTDAERRSRVMRS